MDNRKEEAKRVYLDTSVFIDFIRTTMQRSLKNPVENIAKPGGPIFEVEVPSRAFLFHTLPENIGFIINLKGSIIDRLLEISESSNISYYVSNLVKAEVFRNIRRELSLSENETENLWVKFCSILSLRFVENDLLIVNDEFANILLKFPVSKNVQDVQSIMIAKNNNCWFLGFDKFDGKLEQIKKEVYDKIITLEELNNLR